MLTDQCPVCKAAPASQQGGYLVCQSCGVIFDLENPDWHPAHDAGARWPRERLERVLRACWTVNRTYMMDFRQSYPTFATYAEIYGLHVRPAKWARVRKFWPTWPDRLPGAARRDQLPF